MKSKHWKMADKGKKKNTKVNSDDPDDQEKESLCGKCNKGFTVGGERIISCDICGTWFHPKCSTLSAKLIEEICKINQIHWFCESCQNSAAGILKHLQLLKKEHTNTRAKVNELIERFDKHADECSELITSTIDDTIETQLDEKLSTMVKESIDEKFEDALKQAVEEKLEDIDMEEKIKQAVGEKLQETDIQEIIKESVKDQNTPTDQQFPALQDSFADIIKTPGLAQTSLRRLIREENDEPAKIEALKMNLVITGIPEKPTPETEMLEVITLFEKELNITPEIEKTERIGKAKENEPRLLRMVFKTMRSRREILTKSIELRNSPNMSVKNKIYVRPDMTPNQLTESKNLRDLLRKMRQANPTKRYVIKRNKIKEVTSSPAAQTPEQTQTTNTQA